MNDSTNIQRVLVITLIMILAAASRLLPHPPNFTAIAALGLFGGAMFNNRLLAFLIPLAVLLATDAIIGFHDLMWSVYVSFGLIIGIGFFLKSRQLSVTSVAVASVVGSVLFFLITNFAAWIGSPFYPQNFGGLMTSYGLAIPFFGNTLAGDLFYNSLLFGSFYFVKQWVPSFQSK